MYHYFYPRSPCGERLCVCWMVPSRLLFLSTLSLRRATWKPAATKPRLQYFYPRSPCGERRARGWNIKTSCKFLSTLSLRRATTTEVPISDLEKHFYPRSPCGERLPIPCARRLRFRISIHALLAESDFRIFWINLFSSVFLSTLSLRRATKSWPNISETRRISIHALLAESDRRAAAPRHFKGYFYPRSPCGERQEMPSECSSGTSNFYPRSPCGERQ